MPNESHDFEPRSLHLQGATGAVRTEMLDGREHLVVPVIALMDTVIHAVNSASPERTPLAMLTKAASSWNGRPVTLGHPAANGRQISANNPAVLASHGIGTIFNSRVENGKLQMEEWIDVAKAEKIAGPSFIADTRAAKSHEVSVGAFVLTDGKAGVHGNGKPYDASWTEATGDHLAVLLNSRGACSQSMGCGSHRAAMHLVTAEGIEVVESYDWRGLRDIPQSERDKMDNSDFAGPDESFPIKTQTDVDAASHLVGKAKNPDAVKAKIISIAKRKGLTIPKAWQMKSLRQRVVDMIRGAQEDGPAEEAAELVQYNTILALLTQCGDSYDEAMGIVKELIAAEAEPTTTNEEEAAEEEIESARLESINAHCMQMMGSLSGIMNVTRALLADDTSPDYPRMMEAAAEVRALIGKRHSTDDQQMIQTVHDHSVALGADCLANPDIRAMEEKKGKKSLAFETDSIRAAADHDCTCGDGAAEGDKTMTKVERVKTLIALENSGYTADDAKWLEAVPDARLEAYEVQAKGGLRAAATKADAEKVIADKHSADQALAAHAVGLAGKEKAKEDTADGGKDDAEENDKGKKMKGAAAVVIDPKVALRAAAIKASGLTEEQFEEADWLKRHPSIKTLVDKQTAFNTARKDALVEGLKTLGALTEEQLKAKSLEDLEVLAQFAKIEEPVASFDGRVMPRVASAKDDPFQNPPDGYALAIAARNKSAVN